MEVIKTSVHKLNYVMAISGLVEINLILSKLEAQEEVDGIAINDLTRHLDGEIETVQERFSTYLKRKKYLLDFDKIDNL